jgi:uncharacterized membrane protein (Fun14 family)
MDNNKRVIVVGTTSSFGKFVCNYPVSLMFILLAIGEVVGFLDGADASKLLRCLLIPLGVYLPLILIMYILSNKWCYKIELDKPNNTIVFYRICNRVPCIFKFSTINIVVNAYCHILIDEHDFILHADYIHDFVSYLPKDTVIEYKGTLGKSKEKHWLKGPLIPGNRL